MAVREHSSVLRLPHIRGLPTMLTDPEREEGVRDRSSSWRILPNAYLKVLVGNRGTGPLRLLYRRLARWPKDSGTLLEKPLLERSKDWSFGRSPSSGGSSPDMLLFCSNLKRKQDTTRIHRVFVPIAQNPMWVMQFASNSYQSLHWRTSKRISALEITHKGRTRTED
ncbi:hypothetical protein BHE74_00038846 [Ensete ventricosum]|uniref:Uncharacterized protein n=1 Tax=Ensete ventricosum TaxID=4639 RepID=A0A444CCC0_ENSVE|nr:hypothetical protein B296_00037186 [Ensete ventricosum]RWV83516.1 hypothetical protein GW17_00054862 [Ensete ventricosum]RWW54563.1 hypothetical protein BHE74_00038846 [Ensete ventricosum]RZS10126.1 hypothetical protein BHM03_00041287 [Ensete ventricosum]